MAKRIFLIGVIIIVTLPSLAQDIKGIITQCQTASVERDKGLEKKHGREC